ncbi:MAG: hypothetical protein ACK5O7_06555 [Holosporales bacterium]
MYIRAVVHLYKNKTYAQVYSKTAVGMLSLDGDVLSADENDLKSIGDSLLETFKSYRDGIPHHVEWRDGPEKDKMLEATKCKTWNELMKKSKRIGAVIQKDGVIILTPKFFGGTSGPNKGYHDLKNKEIISSSESEELGRNVMKALELCE